MLNESRNVGVPHVRSLFQSIASVYTGLMQGVGAAEKVFEYLDRKPKHPAEGMEAPDTCTGLVEFKDVTFAYPTRPESDVLQVAAAAPSGCPSSGLCFQLLLNSPAVLVCRACLSPCGPARSPLWWDRRAAGRAPAWVCWRTSTSRSTGWCCWTESRCTP